MTSLNPSRRGKIIVVSAPSGAGKTSLCRIILKRFPELSYSVSHTTRPPRTGEINGLDYFFITHEAFEQRIREGAWAEWARVHGNCYGTSREFIQEALTRGSSLLLDIDVQGAAQIKAAFPEAVRVFIMAPSRDILEKRLRSRGTDSEDVIQKRLENAVREMEYKDTYEYCIINDVLDDTVRELAAIIEKEIR
ncbi:MAG: guanylate kinase [Pseudomonadota bacterium]